MRGKGWISLHRKMLDNPVVCKDGDHVAVWVYLLLNATHAEYPALFAGKKITLKPGQLITGRKVIAEKFNISESKVQRILKSFESEQQIEQQNSNKNRLISILSWEDYQDDERQNEQQLNNKRTTTEQQEFKKTEEIEQQNEQQEESSTPCGYSDCGDEEDDYEQQNEQQLNNKNSDKIEKVNTNNNNNNVFNNNVNKKDIYTPEFESFWTAYHPNRRVGKKVAWGKWQTAIKNGEKAELIISCAANYTAQCKKKNTEAQYILHPSTFLNKERYKDYLEGGAGVGESKGRNQELRPGSDQKKSEYAFLDENRPIEWECEPDPTIF